MSVQYEQDEPGEVTGRNPQQRPAAVLALAVVLAVEALVMLGVSALLGYEVATQPAVSLASSIALLVMSILAAVALGALTVGVWRMQAWARGPVTVWQVLQVAAAVVIIQGDIAPWLGWGLAACSLAGLLLVFSAPVGRALRRDREVDER